MPTPSSPMRRGVLRALPLASLLQKLDPAAAEASGQCATRPGVERPEDVCRQRRHGVLAILELEERPFALGQFGEEHDADPPAIPLTAKLAGQQESGLCMRHDDGSFRRGAAGALMACGALASRSRVGASCHGADYRSAFRWLQ